MNEEWELRVRKVLPRGVNGDVYDLADCLLKQALIGPVPNQLFISYLKHAVQSELVSHGAVLRSIANQPINLRSSSLLLYRTSSIVCILEFLQLFRDKISCNGTEIECLNLCHSLSNLIHWLLKCILHSVDFIISSGSSSSSSANHDTIFGIIDLCTETIQYFIEKPFTKSLLFINKVEYAKEFDDNIISMAQMLLQKLASFPQLQCIQEKIPHLNILNQINLVFDSRDLHPSMVAASQLRYLQTHRIRSTQMTSSSQLHVAAHDSLTNYALFNSLYPLVAFDAILRPARLNKHLARQIVTITTFNSAPVSMAYCEIIRVCLIGLIDAHGNSKAKASWSFFTFLKLPRLLIELNKMFRKHANPTATSPTEPNQASNFINDLKQAFERLCSFSSLLDEAEYKYNCDHFKCLVKELIKNDPSLMNLKNLDFRKFPARRPINANNNNSLGGHMMLRTEPVVTSMLEALNSEQDPAELFSILSQSCSGISFEYTLSAAAATGRLHLFVTRLVEHNELYRQHRELYRDSKRLNQAQDLNFDITFLILIYIAQRYGPKLIDKNKALFNKWYHERYEQDSCFNCPKEMLKDCDDQAVTNLLEHLLGHCDTLNVSWSSVVFNLPKAICEIMTAWDQGTLNDDDIAKVIERLRTRMCFMAVVAASWLRFHARTLVESEKSRPLFILNSLTKSSSAHSKHQEQSSTSDLKNDGYKERLSLMGAIIKRIHFELVPAKHTPGSGAPTKTHNRSHATTNTTSATVAISSNGNGNTTESDDSQDEQAYHSYKDRFISTLTTQEIFYANVKQCLSRGWLDYDSLNSLNGLFKIVGSTCFTRLIVDQILTSHESPSDLGRAVNITFGLFHLDIEACAFTLIGEIIPNWLMGEKKQAILNQPRAFALANLTVMTIIEVYNNLRSSAMCPDNDCVITNNNTIDCDREKKFNLNGIIKKESGLPGQSKSTPMVIDGDVPFAPNPSGPKESKRIKILQSPQSKLDKRDRLNRLNDLISDLMKLFKEIMSDPVMSHRTLFPVLFLQQTVICAKEESSMITVHLQPEILLDIIDLFSSEMTFELVLAISNLSSTNSRKYTAKAVCKLAQVKESKQKPSLAPYSITNNSHHQLGATNAIESQNFGPASSFVDRLAPAGASNTGGKLGGSGTTPMIIG